MEKRQVIIKNQEPVDYDDLVIGLGCEDKYHDIPGADIIHMQHSNH